MVLFPNGRLRFPLPMTRQDVDNSITCYDYRGKPKTHRDGQRYVSPTTGVCRRLVVQSVNPNGPGEKRIEDHTSQTSKLALFLYSTNPFRGGRFFKWVGTWLLFSLKLLWPLVWIFIQLYLNISVDNSGDDSSYNTGRYKPYTRSFRRQLWAARSSKEYSTRTSAKEGKEQNIPAHSLNPRILMVHERDGNRWVPCTDLVTIAHTKFIAISYCPADVYIHDPDREREEQDFIQEVRIATVQQDFNAYWLDLECLGRNPEEKKFDLYCMPDVYRGAETTLIILGDLSDDAWKRWGGRVWALPEALLSRRLYYKTHGRNEINPVTLHQLANLAYSKYDLEQTIIDAYNGKVPMERFERLTLLKTAIWRRSIIPPSLEAIPSTSPSLPSPDINPSEKNISDTDVSYAAHRIYALMGFFEHRIQPDYFESDSHALARLFMTNDNDRIVERMVSFLPPKVSQGERWYADEDVYSSNLRDVFPVIQVAGVTENGALVLDGCRGASIRWKDFPDIALDNSNSVRRTLVRLVCYLAWPCIIAGAAVWTTSRIAGIALIATGFFLLLLSPWLFVFSEGSRVYNPQPWLIGVKGVLDIDKAGAHLYGGAIKGRHRLLNFTPSGSEFAVPDQGPFREGAKAQYDHALEAERGPQAGRMYTLVDTYSSMIYYFCADQPPTVCLFTGREGGLGRFVLCSQRCGDGELRKETVLRMPTYISEKMELCDWVALG